MSNYFFNYLLLSWHLLSRYYILSRPYEYISVPITTEYSVKDYLTQFLLFLLHSVFPLQETSFLSGRIGNQAGVKGSKAELRFKRHSDLRGSYRNPVSQTSHEHSLLLVVATISCFSTFQEVSSQIHSSPHQSRLFQHPIASREQTRRESKHDPCKALFICRSVPSSFCNLRGNLLSGTNAPGQSTAQALHDRASLCIDSAALICKCHYIFTCALSCIPGLGSTGKSGIHLIVPPQKPAEELQRNRNAWFLAPKISKDKIKENPRYKHIVKISSFQLPPPRVLGFSYCIQTAAL